MCTPMLNSTSADALANRTKYDAVEPTVESDRSHTDESPEETNPTLSANAASEVSIPLPRRVRIEQGQAIRLPSQAPALTFARAA
jgi:hypothetical protein